MRISGDRPSISVSATKTDMAAVFFDLDGTLLDTAPDMVTALDRLRAELELDPVDYDHARRYVSRGALGMLEVGFSHLQDHEREAMRDRFLGHYEACLTLNTTPFTGMAELLDALDAAGTRWGVVTNKPGYLAEPLLTALDLARRCASIVSGDTLPQRKPHPAPLLHAAREAGVAAAASVYIGDDRRDIEAGRAAGMTTVAAGYGYIAPGEDPADWGADHLVAEIDELGQLLRSQGWLGVS